MLLLICCHYSYFCYSFWHLSVLLLMLHCDKITANSAISATPNTAATTSTTFTSTTAPNFSHYNHDKRHKHCQCICLRKSHTQCFTAAHCSKATCMLYHWGTATIECALLNLTCLTFCQLILTWVQTCQTWLCLFIIATNSHNTNVDWTQH